MLGPFVSARSEKIRGVARERRNVALDRLKWYFFIVKRAEMSSLSDERACFRFLGQLCLSFPGGTEKLGLLSLSRFEFEGNADLGLLSKLFQIIGFSKCGL